MATEKKIFKDIVYIGQKILEAITRHNDDAEAHPTISKQIKVLSADVEENQEQINNVSKSKADKEETTTIGFGKTTKDAFSYGFTDADNIIFGEWTAQGSTITHLPDTSNVFILKAYRHAGSDLYAYQEAVRLLDNVIFTRKRDNGVWSSWKPIFTIEKIDISDSDLRNNWKINQTISPVKLTRIGDKVIATGYFEGGVTTPGTTIAILPPGFRPIRTQYIPTFTTNNTSTRPQRIVIWTDGTVQVLESDADVFVSFYIHWEVE